MFKGGEVVRGRLGSGCGEELDHELRTASGGRTVSDTRRNDVTAVNGQGTKCPKHELRDD